MYQQFQQPFTSGMHQLGQYGLGGPFTQALQQFPYGQPFGFQHGQPQPYGQPGFQQQPFISPTVNPLEVANIVARLLPLLLQSVAITPWQTQTAGVLPQVGGIFGQYPHIPLQGGLQTPGSFQTPMAGGQGSFGLFGSPWGNPFGHY